ncbi:MAG TPA: serine/threonine protein kinase, partial [Candidatus Egerieimonas intestinavium]|nr:serine/threonine protein kinase [Candidatus Egerieimonas intestinavium]
MEINLCFNCMKEKKEPGSCPHCGFDPEAYEAEPHHLPLGTILAGKYLVGRVLGEGGFGITYVGWDLNLELKVAIKEYYPNGFVTRNSTFNRTLTVLTGSRGEFFQKGLDKFVDEARRLGKFWQLPGIVSVKDYFQENKTGYIVMEFAEGHTLKEILKKSSQGRLPPERVFAMMRPVMKSLNKVHEAGLIHRDISPDNLMVARDGRVKLIDFGAARDFLAEGEKSLSVMLKPGYAPEEQYRSRGKQGPWTDVYGLCATMYRAITGQVPEESLDRVAEDTLRSPSQLGIPIAPWQENALMQGLAVFQRYRLQSMEELE